MTFQYEVLQTAKLTVTLVIILTESTSQHEPSPSKGSHSFPLNILEGGRISDIVHDKQSTTVLLKYKYFDTHLRVSQNSTTHFTKCNTAQTKIKSDIWRSHTGFYHHFTKGSSVCKSIKAEDNTLTHS